MSSVSYTSPAEVHDYNNADGHGDTHNDSCHYMMRAKRKAADNDEEHDEDGGFDEDENTDEVKDDQDNLKGKRRAGR